MFPSLCFCNYWSSDSCILRNCFKIFPESPLIVLCLKQTLHWPIPLIINFCSHLHVGSAFWFWWLLGGNHAVTCSPNEFTCASGQCLEYQRHCDGVLDCADGSDEDGCGKQWCQNFPLIKAGSALCPCKMPKKIYILQNQAYYCRLERILRLY